MSQIIVQKCVGNGEYGAIPTGTSVSRTLAVSCINFSVLIFDNTEWFRQNKNSQSARNPSARWRFYKVRFPQVNWFQFLAGGKIISVQGELSQDRCPRENHPAAGKP